MSEAPLLTPEQLALMAEPIVQSLLYDVNLLPEVLLSLGHGPGHQHWGYLLSVLGHFEAVFKERDALVKAMRNAIRKQQVYGCTCGAFEYSVVEET